MAIPAGDRDLIGFEVVQGVRQSLDGLEGHLHDAGGEGIFPFPGREGRNFLGLGLVRPAGD